MKVALFDAHSFDRKAFCEANESFKHELVFLEPRLQAKTAALARGFDAVCSFVNDKIDRSTLTALKEEGVKLVALRCAGFNHVDMEAAAELKLPVVRVPEYSPYAVAEHALALILALNRKTHRSYNRVREFNFSLDGLVGFDLHNKTVGVIGTGRIGCVFAGIMNGLGCNLLAYDAFPNEELKAKMSIEYKGLDDVLAESDIISLHVPLSPSTLHLLDAKAFARMKKGAMLINTSRGALIETSALIAALKSGHIGHAGLDVYEEEEGVFFEDLSGAVLQDDLLARLITFPNVLITSHQAFLTKEALHNIAHTTLESVRCFEKGEKLKNEIHWDAVKPKS